MSFLLYKAPLFLWVVLILTEPFLVDIHEGFALLVGIAPLLSALVFLYYLLNRLVNRSKRNKMIVLGILIVCLFKYTDHWISYRPENNEGAVQLKVMTWNVQWLGALNDAENSASNLNKLVAKIKSDSCDVVILQEISKRQVNRIQSQLNLSSKNIQWSNYFNGAQGGLVIFLLNKESWKLRSKNTANLPPSWKCAFAEIEHGSGQTINILGVHIAPPKVSDDDVKIAAKKLLKGKDSGIRKIIRRYVRQARKQNQQVDKITQMVNKFKDPTILAGDFNSTCELPLHKILRSSLTDTWIEGGNGIGATRYWAELLPFRIDYIYVTDHFTVSNTLVEKADFSDHNPVTSTIFIEK